MLRVSSSPSRLLPTARYLAQTEVHTYAFSVAANAILSFFPFMVLLMTLIRRAFHSPGMYAVVVQLLRDLLPAGQEFIVRNLGQIVNARKGVQVASLFILLLTSTGVFLPLEVALNQVWGIRKNRSYLGNQMIALGLAFAVGLLTLVSVALTAANQALVQAAFGASAKAGFFSFLLMKVFATLASIAIFFLIYWLLPNGAVPVRKVLPAAVAIGLIWEAGKYVYILALPWLDFKEVYGPFAISVTLIMWAFLSGMLLLAGAHISASSRPATTGNISPSATVSSAV